MTDRELERRLARAVEQTAPNDLEGVLSRCDYQKGAVTPMKKTKYPNRRGLIAACLALLLIGGGGGLFYQQSYAVASVVSLDVNPSIELKVNKNEKVLSCTGLNEEAARVLADMNDGADLKGTKLNVAVNAIVGSLVNNGYLEDISSAILISVEDKDQARAARLRQELTASVDSTLQDSAIQASVLSQTVEQDAALTQQAQTNHISTGKAHLVNQVIRNNPALTDDDATRTHLSELSVEELRDMSKRTDLPGLPVNKSQAAQDVLKYAGLDKVSSVSWSVDSELDEQVPHYEVELRYNSREYDYIVNAFTGEILSGPKDVLATGTAAPKPDNSGSADKMIGEDKALAAAISHMQSKYSELKGQNMTKQSVKLDRDDGKAHYDVEFFAKGYEVDYEIDAVTGAVLEWDTDYQTPQTQTPQTQTPQTQTPQTQTPQTQTPTASSNKDIGQSSAKAAALKHAGLAESQVSRLLVERDMDDGRLEYEVEFKANGMEYEYTIDGMTGAILEHEADWDD